MVLRAGSVALGWYRPDKSLWPDLTTVHWDVVRSVTVCAACVCIRTLCHYQPAMSVVITNSNLALEHSTGSLQVVTGRHFHRGARGSRAEGQDQAAR